MELNVQLFIGQKKEIVFAFDRQLPVTLSGIKIHEDSHLLDMFFHLKDNPQIETHMELNCPIDGEAYDILLQSSHCIASFFDGDTLVEAAQLPLHHNNSEFGNKGETV